VHTLKSPSVTSASPPRHLPDFVREETSDRIAATQFPNSFNAPTVSRTVLPAVREETSDRIAATQFPNSFNAPTVSRTVLPTLPHRPLTLAG